MPAFICERQCALLQKHWTARPTDTFFVDPVEAVRPEFPRLLEASVSRRGWGYVEAMDSIGAEQRRCFSTCAPPSLFPCGNAGLEPDPASTPGFKTVVFVADPRVMLWQVYQRGLKMNQLDKEVGPSVLLEAGFGLGGGACPGFHKPIEQVIEWAVAEAMAPTRVKLLCVEDFFRDPRVALEGLVRFLDVPLFSDA